MICSGTASSSAQDSGNIMSVSDMSSEFCSRSRRRVVVQLRRARLWAQHRSESLKSRGYCLQPCKGIRQKKLCGNRPRLLRGRAPYRMVATRRFDHRERTTMPNGVLCPDATVFCSAVWANDVGMHECENSFCTVDGSKWLVVRRFNSLLHRRRLSQHGESTGRGRRYASHR